MTQFVSEHQRLVAIARSWPRRALRAPRHMPIACGPQSTDSCPSSRH